MISQSLLINVIKLFSIKFKLLIFLYYFFNIYTFNQRYLVIHISRAFRYFWYHIWRRIVTIYNVRNKYNTFLCILFCFLIAIHKWQFQIFIQNLHFPRFISFKLWILSIEDSTFIGISKTDRELFWNDMDIVIHIFINGLQVWDCWIQ